MATSSEAFKAFRSAGVVVFAHSKKEYGSLPAGAKEVRPKGGNTIPMVLVTTANGTKGIDAIPYATLKSDLRKSVRNLKTTLESVDVLGGARLTPPGVASLLFGERVLIGGILLSLLCLGATLRARA